MKDDTIEKQLYNSDDRIDRIVSILAGAAGEDAKAVDGRLGSGSVFVFWPEAPGSTRR